MEDSLDQQSDVAVVDAGDGLAEADGCLVGEAGGQAQHSAFAARAKELGSVQGGDGGFPVVRRRAGAVVDEAGEVVAGEPGAVGDDQPGSGLERVEAISGGASAAGSDDGVMSLLRPSSGQMLAAGGRWGRSG